MATLLTRPTKVRLDGKIVLENFCNKKKNRGERKVVNKMLIKIIKRKDVKATVTEKTRIADEAEKIASVGKDRKELRLRREIIETISNWIPERGKNNRAEEIDAVRKFFGSEHLLSKT